MDNFFVFSSSILFTYKSKSSKVKIFIQIYSFRHFGRINFQKVTGTIIMNFFDSISFPFRVWQALCFSPFILLQLPEFIPTKCRKSYFIKMGVFLFVYSVVIGTFILFAMHVHSRDSWHHISYSIQICLNILTCATILLESFVKRNEQKKLLLQFNDIDLFLKHQIGIEVDYAKQHQRYKTLFYSIDFTESFICSSSGNRRISKHSTNALWICASFICNHLFSCCYLYYFFACVSIDYICGHNRRALWTSCMEGLASVTSRLIRHRLINVDCCANWRKFHICCMMLASSWIQRLRCRPQCALSMISSSTLSIRILIWIMAFYTIHHWQMWVLY